MPRELLLRRGEAPDDALIMPIASNPKSKPNPDVRLGMHQDKDEDQSSLKAGIPVVSISIGDAGDFAYAPVPKKTHNKGDGDFPGEKSVKLESGDLLVFGGPSRLAFHGVRKVHNASKPKGLMMRPGRLNLTFRQYSLK